MNILDRKSIIYLICLLNLVIVRGLLAASGENDKFRNSNNNYVGKSNFGEHIIYIYPLDGAKYITPVSNIIIRCDKFIDPATINNNLFNVIGSLSGKHEGQVILSDDGRTLLFQPDIPFTNGENVTVLLNRGLKTTSNEAVIFYPINFSVTKTNLNLEKKYVFSKEFNDLDFSQTHLNNGNANLPGIRQNIISPINIDSANFPPDFPFITVNKSTNPTNGYLFLATIEGISKRNFGSYNIILDNNGNPVYYCKTINHYDQIHNLAGTDFKIQPNGTLSYFDMQLDQFYILNTSMHILDTVKCGNGYITDNHELRILKDGHILLLGDDYESVDMSSIVPGGNSAAVVKAIVIQEIDKNKNVVFQWRTLDHYKITDATHEDLLAQTIDYVHANAIEIDTDRNILLSARHMDEITKINSQNGDIIWRLGGKNNQFTFVNDTIGFSHQHAIRRIRNGDITMFDNGNFHTPPFSRALEYKLDEVNKTATLVWQFRNNPDIYGSALGYVQRLANGNTLIGWGQANTTLSEVTPDGTVVLEMTLPESDWTYRVYRFPFVFIKSPSISEKLNAGSATFIKWNSSGVDSVDIDYSTDGGNTWNNIVENYPGDVDSLMWSVPNISSANCKIKITESGLMDLGNVFINDSVFTISKLTDVKGIEAIFTYQLFNNYPNPFNPSTAINYSLASSSRVTIRVYNLLGQLVKELVNTRQSAGNQQIVFNAENLSSGVYFYSMYAVSLDGKEEYSSIKKMILLK